MTLTVQERRPLRPRGQFNDRFTRGNLQTLEVHGSLYDAELCSAVLIGNTAAAETCVRNGANVNLRGRHTRISLMHLAAWMGFPSIMKVLGRAGARVNVLERVEGRTPLHVASAIGKWECISALIRRRADLEIPDRNGYTAFHLAVMGNHLKSVQVLHAAGANIHAVPHSGKSLLQLALGPISYYRRASPTISAQRVERIPLLDYLFEIGAGGSSQALRSVPIRRIYSFQRYLAEQQRSDSFIGDARICVVKPFQSDRRVSF